jgi:hypothetical protein
MSCSVLSGFAALAFEPLSLAIANDFSASLRYACLPD